MIPAARPVIGERERELVIEASWEALVDALELAMQPSRVPQP